MRARSTAASVCPARTSTPPGCARKRKHVPGPREIRRLGPRVDRREHRVRAIAGGNARARRVLRFDRDAERCAEPRGVLIDHQRNLELVEPLAGHRHADQPAAVFRHEVDRLRRHLLGGEGQIALVLAIFVVADDDDLAGAKRVDGVFDASERAAVLLAAFCDLQWCSHNPFWSGLARTVNSNCHRPTTYLPTMSHSRFTRSPTRARAQVRVRPGERHDLHVECRRLEPGDRSG